MRGLTAACLLVLITASTSGGVFAQDGAEGARRWEDAIRSFEAADSVSRPPEGAVLFTGSSSIVGWKTLADDFPGQISLNRGFGGSHLSDLLYFADRIILPYRPSRIVVYAGDNDLAAGKSPERVLADFRALVERVHAQDPETDILFIAVKPSPARWGLVDAMRSANALVRAYTEEDERLGFVDIFTPMLGPDGLPRPELYAGDGLHLSPAGYDVWRVVVAPHLR